MSGQQPSREALLIARIHDTLKEASMRQDVLMSLKFSQAMKVWYDNVAKPLERRVARLELILGIRAARWLWRLVTWPVREWRGRKQIAGAPEPEPFEDVGLKEMAEAVGGPK